MNCHPVFRCSRHNHEITNNTLIKETVLNYVSEAEFKELFTLSALEEIETVTTSAIEATSSANKSALAARNAINDMTSQALDHVNAAIYGFKDDIDDAILSMGYITIDSFELGTTITQRNQVLRHAADGKLYRWAGDLPKVVPENSTPTSSGGLGENAWLEVSDVTLRQDLANPDMGAAMIGRGVMAVDSIADLLALTPEQRKEDFRYLVRSYHAGSGKGGGDFYWDEDSSEEDNGGTVFSHPGSPTGRWIRVYSGAISDRMFGGGLDGFLAAKDYAMANNVDVELSSDAVDSNGWLQFDHTLMFGGTESQPYTATVYSDIQVKPPLIDRDCVVRFRHFKGRWVGLCYANAWGSAKNAIDIDFCKGARFGNLSGRRATEWGLRYYTEGNNNSITFDNLRLSLCGESEEVPFTFITTRATATTSQRTTLSAVVPPETKVVAIGAEDFLVTSNDGEVIDIFPAIPAEDETLPTLRYFSGGGLMTNGGDGGVGVIDSLFLIGNVGISYFMGSAYGHTINRAVFEVNTGPSILVGRTPTTLHLKETILDAYFEDRYRHKIIISSHLSNLNICGTFNLNDNDVYYLQNMVKGRHPGSMASPNVRIFDQNNIKSWTKRVERRGVSGGSTLSSEEGASYIIHATNLTVTDDFIVNLTPTERQDYRGETTILLHGMQRRDVVFSVPEGNTIAGTDGNVLRVSGSEVLYAIVYRITDTLWTIIVIPTPVPVIEPDPVDPDPEPEPDPEP